MPKKRKTKIEYRYYKLPAGSPILALLGEKWIQTYGEGIDCLHFHNYLEIGYCYEGQGDMTIGEENYRFAGGQFTIIPKNCPHITNSDPGTCSRWEYLYIDVEKFLRELYPAEGNKKQREHMQHRINSRALLKRAEELPQIADKILQILNIMRESREYYLEEAKGVLISLFVFLARENKVYVQDMDRRSDSGMIDTMISDALAYISEHYMEPIRIEQLADLCHISETHFRRVFSLHMNMGPLEYINLVRIQNACELLKKTDYTVADIAYRCGFSTLSTFNRNFKQITGNSPMEWRKQPDHFEQQLLKFKVYLEQGW